MNDALIPGAEMLYLIKGDELCVKAQGRRDVATNKDKSMLRGE